MELFVENIFFWFSPPSLGFNSCPWSPTRGTQQFRTLNQTKAMEDDIRDFGCWNNLPFHLCGKWRIFLGGKKTFNCQYHYLLPLMATDFELLQGATTYTKLYLITPYQLDHIMDGEEWKTALNTRTGHYKYLVMLCLYYFFYLNNILILSRSLHEHIRYVWQVLQCLLRNHLYDNQTSASSIPQRSPSWD